jgi:hypothetical protein
MQSVAARVAAATHVRVVSRRGPPATTCASVGTYVVTRTVLSSSAKSMTPHRFHPAIQRKFAATWCVAEFKNRYTPLGSSTLRARLRGGQKRSPLAAVVLPGSHAASALRASNTATAVRLRRIVQPHSPEFAPQRQICPEARNSCALFALAMENAFDQTRPGLRHHE